jgi:trimeric autotransporter adhesin
MAYTKYSLTPANNNAAPPDGAPEGMLPSAVNDTMRDMMAQIRDVGDGIRGGTYTMTAPVITGGSITGVALSGNTLTNPVITGGSINNTTVGATTRSTGAFTTLASNGATTFTAGTASTSTTTGTAVITGGLGVSGRINAANFDGIVGANTAAAGNFTTLGATGVATFSAGTVSAPAITTTGDTNTGIFFPAADTIAFAEGGVESMRIDASGNLGIGTSSPNSYAGFTTLTLNNASTGSVLDLNLNGTRTGTIFAESTGLSLQTRTAIPMLFGTNGTERMRIDSSGNVGIGGASIANYKLGVYGDIRAVNAGYTMGGTYTIQASDVGIGRESNGGMIFGTNGTERMRITSAGNVGIGTSSPSYLLEVSNSQNTTTTIAVTNANTGTATQSTVRLNNSTGGLTSFGYTGSSFTTAGVFRQDGGYVYSSGAGGLSLITASTNPLYFATNNTERMRIDGSGNVGIGTSSPAQLLQVAQGTKATTATAISSGGFTTTDSAGSTFGLYFRQKTDATAANRWTGIQSFDNGVGAANLVLQDLGGNVGIGTSSPTLGKLVVTGSSPQMVAQGSSGSGAQLQFYANAATTNDFRVGQGFATASDNIAYLSNQANADMVFRTNSTERMRITSGGVLMVGTTGLPAENGSALSLSGTGRVARIYGTTENLGALTVDKSTNTNSTSQIFVQFSINAQNTGNGQINGNGASQAAFGSFSDRRLKENIVDLPNQLDKIMALRPVEFDYIESEGGGHQISFIAQEFEEVYPDAIGERADGMKTLTGWGKTEARLVKAIQELKAELDSVKAELQTLKGK